MTARTNCRSVAVALLLATTGCGATRVADQPGGGDHAEDGGGQGNGAPDASLDATEAGDATVQDDAALDGGSDAHDSMSDAQDSMTDAGTGCPPSAPEAGAPCVPQTLPYPFVAWCEYGSDPHCVTAARCDGTTSTWVVTPCNGNPSGCPSAYEPDAGGACPVQGLCNYPEGQCGCLGCGGNGVCTALCGADASPSDTIWQCAPWPVPAGCPWPRPLLGTPCSEPLSLNCYYGDDCFCALPLDPLMQCVEGTWAVYQGGGC
jgi:hypothetical protein